MTILNAWIERDRALLAVNSEARHADSGEKFQLDKLWVLPILNAAVAYRGCGGYFTILRAMLESLVPRSFDELGAAMPQQMSTAREKMKNHPQAWTDPTLYDANVVAVGWSTRRGRMIGFQFEQLAVNGFTEKVLEPPAEAGAGAGYRFLAPGDLIEQLPPPRDVAAMVTCARVQKQLIEERYPGLASGGQLHVATLTRGRITIEMACDLDRDE